MSDREEAHVRRRTPSRPRSAGTLLLVALAAVASAACDCVYDFSLQGRAVVAGRLDTFQYRTCYEEDGCDPWTNVYRRTNVELMDEDAGAASPATFLYQVFAGGNGSRCERPSRVHFRMEGCRELSVPVTSDRMEQDIELVCSP